jgi:hypothetical protein
MDEFDMVMAFLPDHGDWMYPVCSYHQFDWDSVSLCQN